MKTISGRTTWVDIVKPTIHDVEFLKKEGVFDPATLDEIMAPSSRVKAEAFPEYIFLIYQVPLYDPILKTSRQAEIDFLVTKDKVITIRHEDMEAIDGLMGEINTSERTRENIFEKNSAILLYHIIEATISFSLRQIRHIQENIHNISTEIFKGNERDLLERISYVKRDLLDYHLISRPQKIVLRSLARAGVLFWGEKTKTHFQDLLSDDLKVQQHIHNYLKIIESLETTNNQLLAAKTTRVIQRFTVLAFLTFPLILFTSAYRIENLSLDFWVGIGVIACIIISVLFLFKKNDVI